MISRRALLSLLAPSTACSVALRVPDGAVLRCDDRQRATQQWAPPGSAIKPLTWMNLPRRVPARCTHPFFVGGRRLDCTHVPVLTMVDGEMALAASCNAWFAEMARSLDPRLFHHKLLQYGARARLTTRLEDLQLQALGLEGVEFTVMGLAKAYLQVATSPDPILQTGLERAVTEGTGQLAALAHLQVAGKTGTTSEGSWFAGYAPSRNPRVVVVAHTRLGHGATDAAPAAREIFEWWQRTASSH
ncbi:penicillin-binding transpeptidase domain-containing protein [uncultured Paludibaculum sp.]|uniref:penicillin-binding transpeptidase domain-containing protein n=1 Tax=uncultured Paludibaculum sp. TaxID=1765020 RepID=UPI002AAC0F38|nr:penicillin-binding transpeptidase domain-containing protein [uncultured Paludibaculum sp.]